MQILSIVKSLRNYAKKESRRKIDKISSFGLIVSTAVVVDCPYFFGRDSGGTIPLAR
jgi:hypothetical protein